MATAAVARLGSRFVGSGRRSRLLILLAVVVVLGGGAVLFTRSKGGDGGLSAAEVADRSPMCNRLRGFRSGIEEVASAAPAQAPATATQVLSRIGAEADTLPGSTPTEVRGDVRSLVQALRSAQADPAAVTSPAFANAHQHLKDYLASAEGGCQAGTESGDG